MIAMMMIFVLIYVMVEFIVMVMNILSLYLGISHFMVGLTLMVWGNSNMEMLNLALAMTKGVEEMGYISALSSNVICMTLVLPVACISRMIKHEEFEIQILQAQHNSAQLILPVLLLVAIMMPCFLLVNMHLNRFGAGLLIKAYFTYVYYSYTVFGDSKK